MNELLQHLLSAGPLYLVAIAVSAVVLRAGPAFMGRWNERLRDLSRAKAGDWARLRQEIKRLDARCALIEGREEKCQQELAGALGRIAALEGYNDGRGKAAQDAAGIVAVERLQDAAERESKP
jgi:hypothetical protein